MNLYLGGVYLPAGVREKIAILPEWSYVRELGLIDRKQVAEIMAESMAGLVLYHPEPNHIDARPNKIFECMAAGIPVIASDFPSWKEIIERHKCGLCVNPLDGKAVTNALHWIAAHPREAEQMGRNGRSLVERDYNWQQEEKKLLHLYDQLLH